MRLCRLCDRIRHRRYVAEHPEEHRAAQAEAMARWKAKQPPKPPKLCRRCGGVVEDRRRWYCSDECLAAARAANPHKSGRRKPHTESASRRGYGQEHKRLRERWKRIVDAGAAVCPRCGLLILPGEPWDLGHVDGSAKMLYQGAEHRRCNRATNRRRRLSLQQW